jgi:hypothetical protein
MMEDCEEGILLASQGWQSLEMEGLGMNGCRHDYLYLSQDQSESAEESDRKTYKYMGKFSQYF